MRYKKSHRITYGRECRFCGDILDPEEECECVKRRREEREGICSSSEYMSLRMKNSGFMAV